MTREIILRRIESFGRLQDAFYGRIAPYARRAIVLANIGLLALILLGYTLKAHGTKFLPLDSEGKISFAAAAMFASLVCGGILMILVAVTLSCLSSWKQLSFRYRIACLTPFIVALVLLVADSFSYSEGQSVGGDSAEPQR